MSLAKVGVFEAGSAPIESAENAKNIKSTSAPLAEFDTVLSLNSIMAVSLFRYPDCAGVTCETEPYILLLSGEVKCKPSGSALTGGGLTGGALTGGRCWRVP